MDHESAVTSHAVERYLLADMPAEERDAFEDHYFLCDQCAADVRATSMFIENAKVLLREPEGAAPPGRREPEPAKQGWRQWLAWLQPQPALAGLAAILVVVAGYEATMIGKLRQPSLTPVAVAHGESRGAAPAFGVGQPVALILSLEQTVTGPDLNAEIRSESGALIRSLTAKAPPPDAGLNLYMPSPGLAPGRYAVVIGGVRYPFEVH